jgi:hypothetical protein
MGSGKEFLNECPFSSVLGAVNGWNGDLDDVANLALFEADGRKQKVQEVSS